VWALLGVALVGADESGAADRQYALQALYLLAFMMVLHCFMAGVLAFSVFAAVVGGGGGGGSGGGARVRLLRLLRLACQASLGGGLFIFARATFRSQGGKHMDGTATASATAAVFLLLAPELLADGFVLSCWSDDASLAEARAAAAPRDAEGDLRAALLAAKCQQRGTGETGLAGLGVARRVAAAWYGALVVCLAAISACQLSAVYAGFSR
jgi:hypothetical protein